MLSSFLEPTGKREDFFSNIHGISYAYMHHFYYVYTYDVIVFIYHAAITLPTIECCHLLPSLTLWAEVNNVHPKATNTNDHKCWDVFRGEWFPRNTRQLKGRNPTNSIYTDYDYICNLYTASTILHFSETPMISHFSGRRFRQRLENQTFQEPATIFVCTSSGCQKSRELRHSVSNVGLTEHKKPLMFLEVQQKPFGGNDRSSSWLIPQWVDYGINDIDLVTELISLDFCLLRRISSFFFRWPSFSWRLIFYSSTRCRGLGIYEM